MKKDYQVRHSELLSPTSTNFLGTGLTLKEFMELDLAEKVEAAWFRQEVIERKRRLHFVMGLCAELDRIKVTNLFATGLAEIGIEAVIEGDWKTVHEWAEHFTFSSENEETRQRYASTFARFSELLMQAYSTRPGEMEVKA